MSEEIDDDQVHFLADALDDLPVGSVIVGGTGTHFRKEDEGDWCAEDHSTTSTSVAYWEQPVGVVSIPAEPVLPPETAPVPTHAVVAAVAKAISIELGCDPYRGPGERDICVNVEHDEPWTRKGCPVAVRLAHVAVITAKGPLGAAALRGAAPGARCEDDYRALTARADRLDARVPAEITAPDVEAERDALAARIEAAKALHVRGYHTTADEVWDRNPYCSCGVAYPCSTVEALEGGQA